MKRRGESLDMSLTVFFDSTNYEFTHGRLPRGFGYWAFDFKKETIFVPGEHTLTEAKRLFKYILIERGVTGIHYAGIAT